MVYFITGRAHSGKTTTAFQLAWHLSKKGKTVLMLDGDQVRNLIPTGFSNLDRYNHIMRIAAFAAIAEAQGITPIIALMAPKKAWRQQARELFKKSKLIYRPGGTLWENTVYEEPDKEELNA